MVVRKRGTHSFCESPNGLIPRPGQGGNDGLAVHRGHPAADGLHPLAVVDTTHVGHIDKRGGGQVGHGGAVEVRLFYLGKASRGLSKDEHDLCDPFIAGKAQCGGRGSQGVVLAGGQVVCQGPILATVHTVGDLIGAGEVIGSGDHRIQPHLCGKGIAPIKTIQPDIGCVGNPRECVAHRLARHDLLGAGFGNGHAGGKVIPFERIG